MASQVPLQLPVACTSTKGSSSVEENLNFFTEKSTRFIYEAQFFEDFVVVRPASAMFYNALRQLSWADFSTEFEDYLGDKVRVRLLLDGDDPDEDGETTDISLL